MDQDSGFFGRGERVRAVFDIGYADYYGDFRGHCSKKKDVGGCGDRKWEGGRVDIYEVLGESG